MIAVGLMSGTSLDGIDAALVRLEPRGRGYAFELLDFRTTPYDDEVSAALRGALPPHAPGPAAVGALDRALAYAFARAARSVSGALKIGFVASHGHTLYHDGPGHLTMQIGDPFVIREAVSATVIYDFRRADCAVGGHGAPLVPYVDALLLGSADEDRVAINIGGIANVTALPRDCEPNDVAGFDSGPGVMAIDAFVRERTAGAFAMDEEGRFARAGRVDDRVLQRFLADPYLQLAPPKSTGRERFGEPFLREHADVLAALSLEDGCATLTELTARTVAAAVQALELPGASVVVSGGGARNPALLARLRALLAPCDIRPSDTLGIPGDAKEAIAFAVLGYETLRERAANVPRVTGASRAVPLGAIAPHALVDLMAEVEAECLSL